MRALLIALVAISSFAQTLPRHGVRPARMVIRGAMVVEGPGMPARGPVDVVVEGNRIMQVGSAPASLQAEQIDGRDTYVLPGLINMHGHIQESRGSVPMDVDYCLKLWLASGITTVRDVGSTFELSKKLRAESTEGKRAAPRLNIYAWFGRPDTPEQARARIREIKAQGGDGVKFHQTYRDILAAAVEEAHAQGLRTAIHVGVEDANAMNAADAGITTIEHWYGIPDAALREGVQAFPPAFNYNNETDRFRYAGRLWREADPEKLGKVLQHMVDKGVAWDTTLSIYEAARDLQRYENQPQFAALLHPALAAFFQPSMQNHGSFFFGWSTEDEVFWKENFRLWMAAVKDFARRGGVVTTGEDAGFIYQMQGFGYARELELHQEAGFAPLEVIQHATSNGARALGKESEIGRVRAGWLADLVVVKGNPLANLKIMRPDSGAIQWVIKDGIPYRASQLMSEVKEIVDKARAEETKPR
ncbi:MAG: amidohydrolase family protein [Acidobacteriota bacterium]